MNKKRVLMVDDEPGFTRLVRLTLSEYEICEENDPRRAVATAQSFRPDLILLDVVMPEMDGGAVAAQIREDKSLQHVPIVFLTAIVSQTEKADQGMIGGFQFLAKPVTKEKLLECFHRYLAD
jgi:two-component system OmpR family response regulator